MADIKGQKIGVGVPNRSAPPQAARFGVPGRTEVIRSPTRKVIDPKDKLAYFKDNVQDDQEEDFDPNMYYYHRDKESPLDYIGTTHVNPAFSGPQTPFGMHHGLMGIGTSPIGPSSLGSGTVPIVTGVPAATVEPQPLLTRLSSSSDSGVLARTGIPSAIPRTNVMPNVTNMGTVGNNVPSAPGLQSPISAMLRPGPNAPVPPHLAGVPHTIGFNTPMTSKLPAKIDNPKPVHSGLSSSLPSTIPPGFSENPPAGDSSSFDLSEFPVLGSRPLAGASQNKPEFNLGGEDFPALPGFKDPEPLTKEQAESMAAYQGLGNNLYPTKMGNVPHSGYVAIGAPNLRTSTHGLYTTPAMSLANSYDGLIPPPGLQPSPTSPPPRLLMSPTHQTAKSSVSLPLNVSGAPTALPNALSTPASTAPIDRANGVQPSINPSLAPDRFGLLGLLSVIRMTEPDLNTLALGTDLTTLGLNLNSPDCLYASFASPFADSPSRREPEFYLPLCYYTQPPMQPPTMKMAMFSEETLFYIFYSMPRDTLQMHAAAELYNHDWRYHKEHKLWFTRVHGTEPIVKTSSYERGSYFYFDPNTWEKMRKDNFVLCYDQLETVSKST